MVFSNRVPWAIITACFVVSAALLMVLRFMLASENRRRDTEQRDGQYDEVYVKQGSNLEAKVDKVCSNLHAHTILLTTFTRHSWI